MTSNSSKSMCLQLSFVAKYLPCCWMIMLDGSGCTDCSRFLLLRFNEKRGNALGCTTRHLFLSLLRPTNLQKNPYIPSANGVPRSWNSTDCSIISCCLVAIPRFRLFMQTCEVLMQTSRQASRLALPSRHHDHLSVHHVATTPRHRALLQPPSLCSG